MDHLITFNRKGEKAAAAPGNKNRNPSIMPLDLNTLLEKSRKSRLFLIIVNLVLDRVIPFNGRHAFRIEEVGASSLKISIPFLRKNKNHINGIHACALATLCEYISGLSLARVFPRENYRLLLKSIQMEYHYQGKSKANASFGIENHDLIEMRGALEHQEFIVKSYEVPVYDAAQHLLCTGKITWQIKPWSKVKAPL